MTKKDDVLQKRLLAQSIGNTVACGGLLLLVFAIAMLNKCGRDSASEQTELDQIKVTQYDHADSLRIYDAANRDSEVRQLNTVRAQRQK